MSNLSGAKVVEELKHMAEEHKRRKVFQLNDDLRAVDAHKFRYNCGKYKMRG